MAPPWVVDGVDTVPRRPRSEYIKRKRGDAWATAAKRVKLEDYEEDDQEQEALEALFSLAGGVPDFAAGGQGPAPRVKIEEPSKPVRNMGHNSSARAAEGRTQRERRQRSSPRDDDDRDWAPSKEPSAARTSITAPKAVKASTSSPPVGTVSMQVPPASNVGLGTGLGAFAGPFPGGINGSFFGPTGPQSTPPQASSAAQGGIWPPPAPFLGGIRRDEEPEATGSRQDVLMPPQRRTIKRCANHVYIAHMIERQLHMERMQKQQQQQRILSRLNGVDGGPQADAMTNGDYVAAASAAPLTERLGSGQSGGGLPASLPKRVTPLQSSAAPQSLGFGNGLGQSMGGSALGLPFPQAASMALCSMQSAGSGQLPQPNGFTPQYAQQLHNQLLMQQGGLPFLNPGMAPFGRARNGGIPAQDLAGFYPQAHMLSLAGFAALGQQLNGATNGFAAPKSEMQDGMAADMGALKRAALASCLKPEDAMKLGLSGPEATNRLHALGVPPGLLASARNPGGPLAGPTFHEQLLAATSAQRPESQGVPLMR